LVESKIPKKELGAGLNIFLEQFLW
jgi:hypothetical protein